MNVIRFIIYILPIIIAMATREDAGVVCSLITTFFNFVTDKIVFRCFFFHCYFFTFNKLLSRALPVFRDIDF